MQDTTLATLTGHTDWVHAVAWAPDKTRLATAGHYGEVRLWDPATGDHLATLTGQPGKKYPPWVYALAWSPDSTRLAIATAGDDAEVRLWNPTTGSRRWGRRLSSAQLSTLTGHNDTVWAIAWSPDGSRLAAASHGGSIRIFDLNHPDDSIFLQFEQLFCLQWTSAGIAVGGSHGVSLLDLICF